jgi:hypothetical protein
VGFTSETSQRTVTLLGTPWSPTSSQMSEPGKVKLSVPPWAHLPVGDNNAYCVAVKIEWSAVDSLTLLLSPRFQLPATICGPKLLRGTFHEYQFMNFKLCSILSSTMKSLTIPPIHYACHHPSQRLSGYHNALCSTHPCFT